MPTLNIGGHSVAVDDSFLKLSPDEQNATVEEIAKSLPAQPAADQAPQSAPSVVKDVAMQVPTGFNEAVANTAGAPVDAMSWALRKAGLPIPQAALGGSQSIKNLMGMISANPDNAPEQTTAGKYARSVGGMVPNIVGGPESLASRVVTRAVVPGLASEAAGQATEGTAAEPIARAGAAMLAGGAASRIASARSAQPMQAMPTIDQVNAEKTRLYNDPALKDLRVTPQAVSNAATGSINTLMKDGFRDHPDYGGPVLDIMRDAQRNTGPVAFDDIETMRKALNKIAGETNEGRPTTNAAAAMRAKGHIDNFVDNQMLNPANVIQGDPLAARAAIKEARATAGAAARSESVLNTLGNAEVNAAAANSGHNVENRIRQAFKPLLKNDEAKMAGYSDEQRDLVNKLVRGTYASDALRTVGNMTSRTGHIGLGVALMHPVTAIPAALAEGGGWAMKQLANKMAIGRATNIADKLLADAPMSQRVTQANATIKAANSAAAKRMMLLNALRAATLAPAGTSQ